MEISVGDSLRILVIGSAGAGKTTLIDRLCSDYDLCSYDVRTVVLQIVQRVGDNDIGDLINDAYSELLDLLPRLDIQILEVANDRPETFFEPLVECFFDGQQGVVVYVSCSQDLCIQRVNQREIITPEYRIKEHCTYNYSFFREYSENLDIPLIEFHGDGEFELEYERFIQVIGNSCILRTPL